MRGLEGGAEGWVIGFGTGVVFSGMVFVGGCMDLGGDSPKDGADHDCEVAWVVANDGDEETINETAILEQPWCIRHLAEREAEETAP